MTAPRSNLPDHVQGRLQLDEYRRGSEDQREDSEDSREPSCHGAHRLVQDSLDRLSRIRADELFELADHLAPDSLPPEERAGDRADDDQDRDRKSTRLNSSHVEISYAVFCLKKKKKNLNPIYQYLEPKR